MKPITEIQNHWPAGGLWPNSEVNAGRNPALTAELGINGLSGGEKNVEYVEVCTYGRKGEEEGSCMHLTIAL